MGKEVSMAPYNFIELEKFVMDRCADENDILNHDRYVPEFNTGYIDYEIEAVTPLHISKGDISQDDRKAINTDNNNNKSQLFKNPEGKYVIPGNTMRGITRFNASIFSFASVKNSSIGKKDIADQKFYYRTYASNDRNMRDWYKNKVGLKLEQTNNFKYTVLKNVEAGYIRKQKDEYVITPAVKVGGRSYVPVHEFNLKEQLRNYKVEGVKFLYNGWLKREVYKDKKKLSDYKNDGYRPYMAPVRYNMNGKKPIINKDGKYAGYLLNSSYIEGKVHHYLVFEEDKNSGEIRVTKEQAELYNDDMKYTQKQNPNGKSTNQRYEYYELPGKNQVKPVFYIKDNNSVIFGFTPYLRLPAEKSIYDGIPESHRDYEGRDFVDSIFGWQSFRTKVSFLDAACISSDVHVGEYQMVLGQPKPSWYKGYVKQDKDGELKSYCSDDFEIRGRKFYWLKEGTDTEAMKLSLPKPGKNDKLIRTIYCYREGTKFAGKVRFENLSNEELGLLLYSLKQGDTEGYLTIGMGKPYGLGKCKIKIDRLVIYDIKKMYMAFNDNFEKTEDMDRYISCFKKYASEHCKINDVSETKSYKEYMLSKHIMKNSATRYMNLRSGDFRKKAELPTIEEVIAGKKFSDKMKDDDNSRKSHNLQKNNGHKHAR